MDVWLATVQFDSSTYIIKVAANQAGGMHVADLDYYERVDGELQWQVSEDVAEARVGDSTYRVKRMEVME